VRIDRPLALTVAGDRVVGELDRPLLRDGALQLSEAAWHLGRVVRVEHLDADGSLGGGFSESRPSQREVLKGKSQRLGVGELPLEQVEGGLQRGKLVVVELQLVEEVVLGAEGVEVL